MRTLLFQLAILTTVACVQREDPLGSGDDRHNNSGSDSLDQGDSDDTQDGDTVGDTDTQHDTDPDIDQITPPVALSEGLNTEEDSVLDLVLQGSDPGDDPLVFEVIEGTTHGTLTGDAPTLTYTPDPDFEGRDLFTFRVSDGDQWSEPAIISIVVSGVNDPPVPEASALSVDEDSSIGFELHARDPDSEHLQFRITTWPTMGSLTGDPPHLNYQPFPTQSGSDLIEYEVGDGTEWVRGSVPIEVLPVQDAPEIDSLRLFSGVAGDGILITLEARDEDGDDVYFEIDPGPGWTMDVDIGDTYRFVGTAGLHDVVWRAIDEHGAASEDGILRVDVAQANERPEARPDSYGTPGHMTLTVEADEGVLFNDIDDDDDPLTVLAATVPSMQGGEVTLLADGSFIYEPPLNLASTIDQFSYSVSDGHTAPVSGQVTIQVGGRVWFVDNTAFQGDGRQSQPFPTLQEAETASVEGDTIVVLPGDGTTTGMDQGIALKTGQKLIGVGTDLDNTPFAFLVGDKPVLTNSNGSAVTLAPQTFVTGLEIASASEHGIFGENVPDTTLSDLDIHGNQHSGVYIDYADHIIVDNISTQDNTHSGLVLKHSEGVDVLDVFAATNIENGVVLFGNWGAVNLIGGTTRDNYDNQVRVESLALPAETTVTVQAHLAEAPNRWFSGGSHDGIAVELASPNPLQANTVIDSVTVADVAGRGIFVTHGGQLQTSGNDVDLFNNVLERCDPLLVVRSMGNASVVAHERDTRMTPSGSDTAHWEATQSSSFTVYTENIATLHPASKGVSVVAYDQSALDWTGRSWTGSQALHAIAQDNATAAIRLEQSVFAGSIPMTFRSDPYLGLYVALADVESAAGFAFHGGVTPTAIHYESASTPRVYVSGESANLLLDEGNTTLGGAPVVSILANTEVHTTLP